MQYIKNKSNKPQMRAAGTVSQFRETQFTQ
jgi:hypothetical protein